VTDAQLHAQRFDDQVVISLRGEVDLENAARVRERIARTIPAAASRMVLDLSEVIHIDSAGVRLLFDLGARFGERRHELTIVAPAGSLVREVVDVVRLESVAAVVDSLDDALRVSGPGTAAP